MRGGLTKEEDAAGGEPSEKGLSRKMVFLVHGTQSGNILRNTILHMTMYICICISYGSYPM
jgi:hypothetical protein